MRTRTIALSLICAFLIAAPLAFGQELQAKVLSFTGKVETMKPGKAWIPVQVGTIVAAGDTISTGFSSSVVLQIGASRLSAKPLTRMLLKELAKTGTTTTTAVTVKVGKINAVVKSAQGELSDFKVTGPSSTASVRGTEFNYDVDGEEYLEVVESVVHLTNDLGQDIAVRSGARASTDGIRFTFPQELPFGRATIVAQAGGKLIEAVGDQGGAVLLRNPAGSREVTWVGETPEGPPPAPSSVIVN